MRDVFHEEQVVHGTELWVDSFPPLWGKVRMGGIMRGLARQLRRKMTDAERFLWKHLRLRHMQGFPPPQSSPTRGGGGYEAPTLSCHEPNKSSVDFTVNRP
jgi:hypothetical protein